tara:strand:+ start:302 stop:1180 length:879 start_codon:yes stop_codon:yes gene_type:complete
MFNTKKTKHMKNLKQILAIGFMFNLALIFAQQQAFVTADNGLTLREKPDVSSERLGKLHYGDEIEITEQTNIELIIIDEGERIAGNWVKIKANSKSGYVFNGYLSKARFTKGIEVHHKGLQLRVKNLKSNDESIIYPFFEKDTVNVSVELGDSPEGKILVINNEDYERVSIFQRFKNSITLMNEDSNCDLTDWKHYNSDWKPIMRINASKFKTLSYSEEDWQKFIKTAIDDLKTEVIEYCGEDWLNYVETIKDVKDNPIGLSTSRIFLKILMTDSKDNITEKIIEFEIPMGY